MPVLVNARRRGREAQCASNLKQLGCAFNSYLSDWNGYYPSPGGMRGDFNYWSQTSGGGIVSYVKRNGGIGTVWCCPEQTAWSGAYPARTYSMNSYLRDPPDISYPSCVGILRGIHESIIEDRTRTILLFEGMPVTLKPPWPSDLDYIYRCGDWTCVRGWFPKESPRLHTHLSWLPWHGQRNYYLYCDGHVRAKIPDKYPRHPPYDVTNEWWVRKSAMAAKMNGW